MTQLLIVPANSAIRQNPRDPKKFPTFELQEILPDAAVALQHYKAQGYTIAVCENAGAVGRDVTPFLEKMTEMVNLMTLHAPQIDLIVFCTDYMGAFSYVLTKANDVPLPIVKRIQNIKVIQQSTSPMSPPDDSNGTWKDFTGSPFRKPDCGMLSFAVEQFKPDHVVGVWEREEDYQALMALNQQGVSLVCQSASFWRNQLDPCAIDSSRPLATPAPSQQIAQTLSTDPRTQWKRFELVNAVSNKFWEIRLTDDLTGFIVRYGRRGTKGREKSAKLHSSPQKAIAAYETIIRLKKSKGYQEC